SRGRAEAHHVAERRGIAQRTSEIAAIGNRQQTRGQRNGRTAAAAAARAIESVRITRGAEDRVERLRTGAELRCVRLADQDRARRTNSLDEQIINVGDEV